MKPIFSRGPSLQIRLILAVLVALGIIIADSRLHPRHEGAQQGAWKDRYQKPGQPVVKPPGLLPASPEKAFFHG